MMEFPEFTLEQLGREAKARIEAGDKAKGRSEDFYKSAGLILADAKKRLQANKTMNWPTYLLQNCPIGARRADEMIQIADGRVDLSTKLANDAARKRTQRADATWSKASAGRPAAQHPPVKTQQPSPVEEVRDWAEEAYQQDLKEVIAMVRSLSHAQLIVLKQEIHHGTQS